MAKPPKKTDPVTVDPKFEPLVEEARNATEGRLYFDKDRRAHIGPHAPHFDKDLVEEAVKLGLFKVSETAGRHGGIYLTDKGREAEFGEAEVEDPKAGAKEPA
jgi:hypothetical protein